eukprot:Opistho-1_new@84469
MRMSRSLYIARKGRPLLWSSCEARVRFWTRSFSRFSSMRPLSSAVRMSRSVASSNSRRVTSGRNACASVERVTTSGDVVAMAASMRRTSCLRLSVSFVTRAESSSIFCVAFPHSASRRFVDSVVDATLVWRSMSMARTFSAAFPSFDMAVVIAASADESTFAASLFSTCRTLSASPSSRSATLSKSDRFATDFIKLSHSSCESFEPPPPPPLPPSPRACSASRRADKSAVAAAYSSASAVCCARSRACSVCIVRISKSDLSASERRPVVIELSAMTFACMSTTIAWTLSEIGWSPWFEKSESALTSALLASWDSSTRMFWPSCDS